MDSGALESVDLVHLDLTDHGRGPISAPMIDALTIATFRRRRTLAVWAADRV